MCVANEDGDVSGGEQPVSAWETMTLEPPEIRPETAYAGVDWQEVHTQLAGRLAEGRLAAVIERPETVSEVDLGALQEMVFMHGASVWNAVNV